MSMKGEMPDPADYADRFSGLVDQWKVLNREWIEAARTGTALFDHNTGASRTVNFWDIQPLDLLERLLREQQQFNVMVVAALDKMKVDENSGVSGPTVGNVNNSRVARTQPNATGFCFCGCGSRTGPGNHFVKYHGPQS